MMLSRRMLQAAAGANYTPTPPTPPGEWWEAGGVTDVLGAWSGLYAANKADSLLDLSGNGNDLTENGTVAWLAGFGWYSFSSANWLDTGILPVAGDTLVVSFADASTSTFIAGAFDGSTYAFTLMPFNSGVLYWAGANQATRGANMSLGVIGLADNQPYRMGAVDGAALGSWGGAPGVSLALGKLHGFGSGSFDATIRRAVYLRGTVPSSGQMKALMRATFDYAAFFGDSITTGTGASDAAHRWVNLVAADQGWGKFLNAGIGGTVLQNTVQNATSTIGAAADNNGRDTYAGRIGVAFPNHIFILYGLNDLRLNDVAFTVANYENDLDEIVAAMIADGVPADNIVIGSPPYMKPSFYASYSPFNGGSTMKHEDYVAAALAVATANGTRYTDVYQAMLDGGDDSLIDADGVHPNDSGHAVIAAAFIAALA